MNTTKLITHWTMNGARIDADGGFRATDDIGAAIANSQPIPDQEASAGSFLIKGTEGDGWHPIEEAARCE